MAKEVKQLEIANRMLEELLNNVSGCKPIPTLPINLLEKIKNMARRRRLIEEIKANENKNNITYSPYNIFKRIRHIREEENNQQVINNKIRPIKTTEAIIKRRRAFMRKEKERLRRFWANQARLSGIRGGNYGGYRISNITRLYGLPYQKRNLHNNFYIIT